MACARVIIPISALTSMHRQVVRATSLSLREKSTNQLHLHMHLILISCASPQFCRGWILVQLYLYLLSFLSLHRAYPRFILHADLSFLNKYCSCCCDTSECIPQQPSHSPVIDGLRSPLWDFNSEFLHCGLRCQFR
jgi:hypothetical protein